MTFLQDLRDAIGVLEQFEELQVELAVLPASASSLSDASVREVLTSTARLGRTVGTVQAVFAGIAAQRSSRDKGHGGFAGDTGHRNAVELIRDLTGTTRGEANRTVKVGEALLESTVVAAVSGIEDSERDAAPAAPAPAAAAPWHEPLGEALLAGHITTAQAHVIRTGLGAPPTIAGRDCDEVTSAWRGAAQRLAEEATLCTVEELGSRARALRDMMDPASAEERFAARFGKRGYRHYTDAEGIHHGHIVFDDEFGAYLRAVFDTALSPRRGGPRFVAEGERDAAEELANDPRTIEQLQYDLLMDIFRAGVTAQSGDVFGDREAAVRLVTIVVDDVDDDASGRGATERDVAKSVATEGVATEADTTEGVATEGVATRGVATEGVAPESVATEADTTAGVATEGPTTGDRAVGAVGNDATEGAGATGGHDAGGGTGAMGGEGAGGGGVAGRGRGRRDVFGRLIAVCHLEDGGQALPGSVLERALCVTGTLQLTVDRHGNPLDVGREQRLFTRRQRRALAIRDGGCMWPGCDRPPSYTEAHHIDHWSGGGRTDIDRGILLCRFHHLNLHNNGWRITREGSGPFMLHPPLSRVDPNDPDSGRPIPLRSKSPLRWLWDPPPDRASWRTAA